MRKRPSNRCPTGDRIGKESARGPVDVLLRQKLNRRWQMLMSRLGISVDAAQPLYYELAELYSGPERHYHTLEHVKEMLDAIQELAGHAQDPDLVALAAWFHDAIYDSRRSDNEEQSAALAARWLEELGLVEAKLSEVLRLIMLTQGHLVRADDRNGAVLIDADLERLAASRESMRANSVAMREEYRWVSAEEYEAKRVAVLRHFLSMERLFQTSVFFERYEKKARQNLEWEILTGHFDF